MQIASLLSRCGGMRLALAGVCLAVLAGSALGGKTEQIQVEGKEGYSFFLYIPDSYSDENPAGVHMFFSGQGGCANNGSFGQWKGTCEKHNLIGINLQYKDGNNARDTSGKTEAAITALRHVIENYKVIPGRGMVGSFSGGGLPHAGLQRKLGRRADSWPFCHTSLYGSNYWLHLRDGTGRMSWLVAVGSNEWGMGKPTLGDSQGDRANDLLGSASRDGSADVYYRITKGKGHTITGGDVQAAAEAFERSDLAFCGFLYAPDYPEEPLKSIVQAANRLDLGAAAKLADAVKQDPNAPEEIKSRASALAGKINQRAEKLLAMAKHLAETDPALLEFYAQGYSRQLRTHPAKEELDKVLTEARKDPAYQKAVKAWRRFVKTFAKGRRRAFFPSGSKCYLNVEAAKFFEDIRDQSPPASLAHKMASEFLAMKDVATEDDK